MKLSLQLCFSVDAYNSLQCTSIICITVNFMSISEMSCAKHN